MINRKKLGAATLVLSVVFAISAVFSLPQTVNAKPIFKLSSKSISIASNKDVTLTSNKKKEKINVTVQKPDIVAVAQKSQKGKKTVFTVLPKIKGTTKVYFRSGKKKATLTVKVTKSLEDSIKNGFSAQLFTGASPTGSVHLMIHNHTGLNAYCSNFITIHGDIDYDGHWFDPNADFASQSASQYAVIGGNEDRQIDYYNAPVYGLRFDQTYNLMAFSTQAAITMTVYFDQPTADNAYTVTVDTNGVTSFVKLK